MDDNLVQIDRLEILRFFDTSASQYRRHSNAIVAIAGEELGIGLLKHYFESSLGISVDIQSDPCTPGTSKGSRLDRWVVVHWTAGSILYQVEIKNWSANSLNGKQLPIEADPGVVSKHKVERWACEWDDNTQSLRKKQTIKVLSPMASKRPEPVEPLLCMWDAMHPKGERDPWFSVTLAAGHIFRHLNVFSMSGYLRSIEDDFVAINMPDTLLRLRTARRIFPSCL